MSKNRFAATRFYTCPLDILGGIAIAWMGVFSWAWSAYWSGTPSHPMFVLEFITGFLLAGIFPSAAIMLIPACPMWLIAALHPDYELIVLYDWEGKKYHSLVHKEKSGKWVARLYWSTGIGIVELNPDGTIDRLNSEAPYVYYWHYKKKSLFAEQALTYELPDYNNIGIYKKW